MEAMMSGNAEDLRPLYEKPAFDEEAFDQGEPWWRFEFPDKLDGVLCTIATLLWVDRPDRHEQIVAVCEALRLLGLAVRTTDDESFCYRATPELIQLARRSKDFKGALRKWIEKQRPTKAGFATIAGLILGKNGNPD
jgi:hypothetical protein